MPEINEGYEIIAAETYLIEKDGRQARITLGRCETKYGAMFVTWDGVLWPGQYQNRYDYYWGHYFDDEAAARADYHKRLSEKYEAGSQSYTEIMDFEKIGFDYACWIYWRLTRNLDNEVKEGKVYRPRSLTWTGCEYQVDVTLHPSQRWKVIRLYDWGYALQNHFVTIYFKKDLFDLYFVEVKKRHERKS